MTEGLGGRRQPSLLALSLALALGSPLGAVACGGGTSSQSSVAFGSRPPTVAAPPAIAKLERAMLSLVNRDRKKVGLPPLQFDEALADIARAHSQDMRDAGYFSHDSPTSGSLQDRLDAAGYLALEARENLASAPTIERAEENLLDSAAHRANIEATTMTHVGIGIVEGDRFGDAKMLTVTQVFGKPAELQSAADVAAGVLDAVRAARSQAGRRPLQRLAALDGLAEQHVGDVPADLADAAALERIGDQVAEALQREGGHGLKAVQIAAQAVIRADQFDTSGAPLAPQASKLGMASAAGRDAQGRPQVKVLLLIGQ